MNRLFCCLSGIAAVHARSASGEGSRAVAAPVHTNDSVCPAGCRKPAPRVRAPERLCSRILGIAAWPPSLPYGAMCASAATVVRRALHGGTCHSTSHQYALDMLPVAAHVSLMLLKGAGGVAPTSDCGQDFDAPRTVVRHGAVATRSLHAASEAGSERSPTKHILG
jgi:hypothetical protein